MRALHSPAVRPFLRLVLALSLASCSGGGTEPPAVATVTITAGATTTFQTFTRTSQLGAVARDAGNAVIPGVTIAWNSSAPTVATVNGSGLVTAVGNGTTQVTATAGGVNSTPVAVTVAQYATGMGQLPASVQFGALGSTRQLNGAVTDSSGAGVAAAPAVTWTRAGSGVVATVSPTGLITSVGVGNTDTAVATAGTTVTRVPITVTQLITSIVVTGTGTDSLHNTGSTKAYTAVARDSNANVVPGQTFGWASSAPAVATVGAATGIATAVSDGDANVVATITTTSGQRLLRIRRYATTFTMTPGSATITIAGGSQVFTGTASDTSGANLAISWLSRTPAVAGIAPTTGTTTTATATGNGTSQIVMQAGLRADSALFTASNQAPPAPIMAAVDVGDIFFRSTRNFTQNPAIDTVAVGGTVTWTFVGATSHTVESRVAPTFTSSTPPQLNGTYTFTFTVAGEYRYDCALHGIGMTGRIVVR